jgi:hypothetical protein
LLVADFDAALESSTALFDAGGEFVRYVADYGRSGLGLGLLKVVVLAVFGVHEGGSIGPALFLTRE